MMKNEHARKSSFTTRKKKETRNPNGKKINRKLSVKLIDR